MVCFTRNLGDISINIFIDIWLYNNKKTVFNRIFRSYVFCEAYVNIADNGSIYITEKYVKNLNCYVCNILKKDWIQDLINTIEEWQADVLNCTVLHGSALSIKGKGILVLGNRKKGKTTLTGYLSLIEGHPYLDDDCIYCYHNKYIGFNMPISIRKNVDDLPSDCLIGTTTDIDNIERNLFISSYIKEINRIDLIIFPNYNETDAGEMKFISDRKILTNLLIKNTRHHNNLRNMCIDISNLSRSAIALELSYPNSKTACEMIYSVIDSM